MNLPDPTPLSRLRILVVDDHPHAAESLSTYLELQDCEVETAYDGSSAIHNAQRWLPDAILLDLEMPVMDGYEVARRLRADPKTQDIPIIGLSAWLTDDNLERALDAGVTRYLVKPVSPDELQRALLDCVNHVPQPLIVEGRSP